ncbi:MAG TPA: tetratricopeptide repeat protein, partial [Vicinamibacterales bacterium]|nr:tetratricopeptide repeat protein [Vicinamibacterales bacterium]
MLVASIVGLSGLTPGPAHQLSIARAVELYQAGERRRALDALDTGTSGAQFTTALNGWISSAGAASESRRRFVAAAFALDAVWAATRASVRTFVFPPNEAVPLRSRQSLGVVAAWAARQMPAAGPVTPAERALWLAAIGVAEDAEAWRALHTDVLPLARRRLPDEPRVRLATVLAAANVDLGSLRRYWIENLNPTKLREERLPSSVTRRIPGAIRSFEVLLTDASLAGEVELRIGYLELRRQSWSEALERFEGARTKAADPLLQATADYLGGWVHEQRGDPDRAIAAYRQALILAPTMRNLATRLSALLF